MVSLRCGPLPRWDDQDIFSGLGEKPLGHGAFSSVFKGVTNNGWPCAIKRMHKRTEQEASWIEEELRLHALASQDLGSEHIVPQFLGAFEDDHHVYLVMERCRGPSLHDLLQEQIFFSEQFAAYIIQQVCRTVRTLHASGLIHRDVKPENFLFLEDHPCSPLLIIDFGLSKDLRNENAVFEDDRVGSYSYVAPEVEQHGCYSRACDMWSVGVMTHVFLTGETPAWVGLHSHKQPRTWPVISQAAKSLIQGLLHPCYTMRTTAQQVLDHPWIVQTARVPSKLAFLHPRSRLRRCASCPTPLTQFSPPSLALDASASPPGALHLPPAACASGMGSQAAESHQRGRSFAPPIASTHASGLRSDRAAGAVNSAPPAKACVPAASHLAGTTEAQCRSSSSRVLPPPSWVIPEVAAALAAKSKDSSSFKCTTDARDEQGLQGSAEADAKAVNEGAFGMGALARALKHAASCPFLRAEAAWGRDTGVLSNEDRKRGALDVVDELPPPPPRPPVASCPRQAAADGNPVQGRAPASTGQPVCAREARGQESFPPPPPPPPAPADYTNASGGLALFGSWPPAGSRANLAAMDVDPACDGNDGADDMPGVLQPRDYSAPCVVHHDLSDRARGSRGPVGSGHHSWGPSGEPWVPDTSFLMDDDLDLHGDLVMNTGSPPSPLAPIATWPPQRSACGSQPDTAPLMWPDAHNSSKRVASQRDEEARAPPGGSRQDMRSVHTSTSPFHAQRSAAERRHHEDDRGSSFKTHNNDHNASSSYGHLRGPRHDLPAHVPSTFGPSSPRRRRYLKPHHHYDRDHHGMHSARHGASVHSSGVHKQHHHHHHHHFHHQEAATRSRRRPGSSHNDDALHGHRSRHHWHASHHSAAQTAVHPRRHDALARRHSIHVPHSHHPRAFDHSDTSQSWTHHLHRDAETSGHGASLSLHDRDHHSRYFDSNADMLRTPGRQHALRRHHLHSSHE